MDLFMYGLEFSFLGFFVVLFALYILALILQIFNKLFSGIESPPKQDKGGQGGKGAPAQNSFVGTKDEPASAVSLQGQKPEIVAAAMGAHYLHLGRGTKTAFCRYECNRSRCNANILGTSREKQIIAAQAGFCIK